MKDAKDYGIHGVDVSSYQGEIDWPVIAAQGMRFAFIKATEGASNVDARFAYNIKGALDAGLYAGAYHFFGFSSKGGEQAENLCRALSPFKRMLPPVLDVEYSGSYKNPTPEQLDAAKRELRICAERISAVLGVQPLIYCPEDVYFGVIRGSFDGLGLWIRNVSSPPDGRIPWLFWQYSSTTRLKGYTGPERCIDLNVFGGSEEELKCLALH